MSQVLIVDDEESICWGLARLLREAGHRVSVASSAEEALLAADSERPQLVVMDVRLPGMDGLSAMKELTARLGPIPIVVITAFGNLETAVTAVQNGAFDYLPKPFDLEQATTVIERALAVGDPRPVPAVSELATGSPEELLGASAAMQDVFKRIALVAGTDCSVLITGESGTGKELVARAIHRHSLRADRPFVPINLASLSPTLVESELFGHVKGAFTGADAARAGLLELADGATVFFDEAADIPPNVQVKLLRVIEQLEVTPVGDTQSRRSAFRAITATSRQLGHQFGEAGFRQDLYFRLAVFEIHVPPLRSRVEDIPLLAERFLARISGADARPARFTSAAIANLCRRRWPGNVRELRNAVEHAALVARGGAIGPEHLPPPIEMAEPEGANVSVALSRAVREWATAELASAESAGRLYEQFLAATESPLFETVLHHTLHNRAAAADLLGIHRATLRKKLL
ncbi:MAG TPA: sigma-54 dependent transcriptional regulator [Pirellulales bacterium]|jgi:two-component system nitrogen regulation response regulator GlnG|nr:sigma-54 dependent transcriptional regulator [Pirellulales bacterium]